MHFLSFTTDYVRRLTAGDPEVQEHFTRYFDGVLHMKLRSRLRSLALIEDVRQETFLRVFRALRNGSLICPDRLGAFVNAVCNHVLLETYRDKQKHELRGEEPPERADPNLSPEGELATRERDAMVGRTLSELSHKDSELLRMIFLEERDKAEICRNMNVDHDYLRVLIFRAKSRFGRQWRNHCQETSAHA